MAPHPQTTATPMATSGDVQPQAAAADLTPSLVARLRSGDADAGLRLCELYREAMLRFCSGYLGNAADAEDAVQEVFCKVLTAAQVGPSFRPWLYKVARNHCLNIRRGRARRREAARAPSGLDAAASLTGNLTKLVHGEQRSRLAHLVAALPEAQREALRLRYVEDLSRGEIAEVLDEPESVVKSRLFEGLQKLRQHTSIME